jgi:hypothetical protein
MQQSLRRRRRRRKFVSWSEWPQQDSTRACARLRSVVTDEADYHLRKGRT